MSIHPSRDGGIHINGIIVTPQTLQPISHLGARYLSVVDPASWEPVAQVVEHLISGCYAAGIRNARIQTPATVPIYWGGIDGIYSSLMNNSNPVKEEQSIYRINRDLIFYSKDWSCELHISPADHLDVHIERKNDIEINANAELTVKDVYTYIQNNESARRARPIARLKNPIVHGLQKWIMLLGWKGVTPDNYIFNTKRTTQDELKERMYPTFQPWNNEHLAHTLVADFFWELHTFFPNGIHAKIELKWKNNHFTRMELLNALYSELGT
jgi:UDP-3-O-acyl N-acetylglycosamine deacetylase